VPTAAEAGTRRDPSRSVSRPRDASRPLRRGDRLVVLRCIREIHRDEETECVGQCPKGSTTIRGPWESWSLLLCCCFSRSSPFWRTCSSRPLLWIERPTEMPRRYLDRPYAWRTVVRALKSGAKKTTVEDCLVLSVKELFDRGLIERGAFRTGSWRWADSNIFQVDGMIRYEADLRNHERASLRCSTK
jgi:hypothetical protein